MKHGQVSLFSSQAGEVDMKPERSMLGLLQEEKEGVAHLETLPLPQQKCFVSWNYLMKQKLVTFDVHK